MFTFNSLWFAACALSLVVAAIDPYLRVEQTGVEGFRSSRTNRWSQWGSHAIYPDGATFSDDNLIMIAKQGYLEMENDLKERNVKGDKWPSVMTALLVDNEVFLASSGKFGQYQFGIRLADEEVNGSLQICHRLVLGDNNGDGSAHNNLSNCGEQFAVHFYYTTHPQPEKTLYSRADDKKARIVTVGRRGKDQENAGELCVRDPCATEPGPRSRSNDRPNIVPSRFQHFGCDAFNQAQKLNTIVVPESEMCDDREISGLRPTRTRFFTFRRDDTSQEPTNRRRAIALAERQSKI